MSRNSSYEFEVKNSVNHNEEILKLSLCNTISYHMRAQRVYAASNSLCKEY